MGVSPDRVFYVPNGVGEEQARGRSREVGGEREGRGSERSSAPSILLYTRFFEFPVSRVFDVLRRVRERVPGTRLLVVGEGLFGEEKELFRMAEQSGLTVATRSPINVQHAPCLDSPVSAASPDITYAGWVPIEELPSYFARASVAMYPFDDTLVNRTKCAVKLRDLLAAGVPVVAEAVGQNREMVRHGETGWLVQPGDVAAFAKAVVRLLEDAPLRERLGQAAARDLRERFAWDRLVEAVEWAYRMAR
jgi:glycosyltransferase involved in cell wall biosynthesis